jgi:N-acetylglucosaminyldiphosphoundecaprenol N-acetyl-beta-D-mannosaminyltransferase
VKYRPRNSTVEEPTFDGHVFQRDPYKKVSSVLSGHSKDVSLSFHLVAVSTLYAASKDENLRRVLDKGVLICDSTPIAKLLNLTQGDFSVCRGTDFLRYALSHKPNLGGHFFLGGTEITLNKLHDRVRKDFPNIQVVGKYSPPFQQSTSIDEIVLRVQLSKPAYVWVGMGSPKQDFIAEAISTRTGITTFAVGAAFDFLAGTVPESPDFLKGSGFEWLYRLCLEPKRLWKRYVFGNFFFIRVALRSLPSRISCKNR